MNLIIEKCTNSSIDQKIKYCSRTDLICTIALRIVGRVKKNVRRIYPGKSNIDTNDRFSFSSQTRLGTECLCRSWRGVRPRSSGRTDLRELSRLGLARSSRRADTEIYETRLSDDVEMISAANDLRFCALVQAAVVWRRSGRARPGALCDVSVGRGGYDRQAVRPRSQNI